MKAISFAAGNVDADGTRQQIAFADAPEYVAEPGPAHAIDHRAR